MAKRIGDIVPFIGGAEFVPSLFPLIEGLLSIEETVVRNAAALSVAKIITSTRSLSHATLLELISMTKRLTAEELGEIFYSKVSINLYIGELYRVLQEPVDRATLQEIYFALCRDEMPIVRRAAAAALPKFIQHSDASLQSGELLQLLKNLSIDDNQFVRVFMIQAYPIFIQTAQQHDVLSTVISDVVAMIKAAVDDSSWRLRLAVVKDYGAYASALPAESVQGDLFHGLVNLLHDTEAEVRTLACSAALPFLTVCGTDTFMTEVVPIAMQLAEDASPAVRKALADMSVDVAAKLGPDVVPQHMNDLVVKCLSDEDALVRLRVIARLHVIARDVPNLLTRITPTVKAHFSDDNWRVRKQLCESMPAIITHMGTDFFSEHFLASYLDALKDGVKEVREGAASALPNFVTGSSSNWVYENIFPTIKSMASMDYLIRLTMLSCCKFLFRAELSERFQGALIPLMLTVSADVVPNVRLSLSKILGEIHPRLPESHDFKSDVLPILSELESDKDKDVRYFATEAKKLYA